jgi:hypothetical protein
VNLKDYVKRFVRWFLYECDPKGGFDIHYETSYNKDEKIIIISNPLEYEFRKWKTLWEMYHKKDKPPYYKFLPILLFPLYPQEIIENLNKDKEQEKFVEDETLFKEIFEELSYLSLTEFSEEPKYQTKLSALSEPLKSNQVLNELEREVEVLLQKYTNLNYMSYTHLG